MADTPWCGPSKLYLQSGTFTSTLKTSQYVASIDTACCGITYDEVNSPWSGDQADKLYLQSGQFTSTLKTSQAVDTIDNIIVSISYDGTNTPWAGQQADKLYLQSGQFTSTLKTSQTIGGIDSLPIAISYDGTNTPWAGNAANKLYLQSGQFTSTLKTSEDVSGVDTAIMGISWNGTNTPWCGDTGNKLYLQSGQFTSTLKTSQDVSSIETSLRDICTNDFTARTEGPTGALRVTRQNVEVLAKGDGKLRVTRQNVEVLSELQIFEETAESTISYIQSAPRETKVSRTVTSTVTYIQTAIAGVFFNRAATSTIVFNSSSLVEVVYDRSLTSYIDFISITGVTYVPAVEIPPIKEHWPRWIFASVSKHFQAIADAHNLHMFIEGTDRFTNEPEQFIEFRIDGPDIRELSHNYYRLNVDINILFSIGMNDYEFHSPQKIAGIIASGFTDIHIYRYGDGVYDTGGCLGTLRLMQDRDRAIRINHFGQIRADARLIQGTVAGEYQMFLTLQGE